jgi:putative membrane protein
MLGLLLLVHVAGHGWSLLEGLPPATHIEWHILVPVWSAFGLLHAVFTLGWRRTLWFLGLAVVVSLEFEVIGVWTGWPYGEYFYTDVLGVKILGAVPVLIPFAYFMMLYPSHVIVNLIIDGQSMSAERRPLGIVAAGVLTGIVMTGWDLTTDPVMVGEVGAWVWEDGGPYFGIPMQNFAGWVLVVTTISVAYRFVERRVPLRPIGQHTRLVTLAPLIGYGTMALADALVGMPEATRLLPAFAMGGPLLAALIRLFESDRVH